MASTKSRKQRPKHASNKDNQFLEAAERAGLPVNRKPRTVRGEFFTTISTSLTFDEAFERVSPEKSEIEVYNLRSLPSDPKVENRRVLVAYEKQAQEVMIASARRALDTSKGRAWLAKLENNGKADLAELARYGELQPPKGTDDDAESTRTEALEMLVLVQQCRDAIDNGSLQWAVLFMRQLEYSRLRLRLHSREMDAKVGRETRAIRSRAGKARAKQRAQENTEKWAKIHTVYQDLMKQQYGHAAIVSKLTERFGLDRSTILEKYPKKTAVKKARAS